jgi:hypothetical protein
MFETSYFQKEMSKNIVFWVSYSENKFLTTKVDWQLIDHNYKMTKDDWLQID